VALAAEAAEAGISQAAVDMSAVRPVSPAREELRRIWRLAAPVMATQVGMMMLGVVDNLMLGRVSVEALGACALGRVWVMGTFLVGMGFVLGIDPIVSQAHGAHDGARAGLALQQGLVIALLAALPIGGSWIFAGEILVALGQEPELARVAEHYALVQLPGLPCFLCFVALRHWLQGRGIVRPALFIALFANVVNAAGNWVLIFGNLGSPALGVVGAGISTAVTQVAMLAALVWLVVSGRLHEGGWAGWTRAALLPRGLLRVAALGAPIAATIGLEMWAFQLATLWSGRIDGTALAAHTITINMASLTFMPALGISIGAATRVGNLIGAGDPHGAQRSAWLSLALSTAWMTLTAIAFLIGREHLPLLYTADPAVIALASSVFPIAAAFQVFDGLQVVGSGCLRGMGKTVPSALFNLLGYYALGLPFAWWLAFEHDAGLPGIWWGLCIGLGAVGLSLVAWIALRGPARLHARVE
jgi:MATE family multidrug resistance protein